MLWQLTVVRSLDETSDLTEINGIDINIEEVLEKIPQEKEFFEQITKVAYRNRLLLILQSMDIVEQFYEKQVAILVDQFHTLVIETIKAVLHSLLF